MVYKKNTRIHSHTHGSHPEIRMLAMPIPQGGEHRAGVVPAKARALTPLIPSPKTRASSLWEAQASGSCIGSTTFLAPETASDTVRLIVSWQTGRLSVRLAGYQNAWSSGCLVA